MLNKKLRIELNNLSKYKDKNKLYTILLPYAKDIVNSVKKYGQMAISKEIGVSQTKMGILYNTFVELTTQSSTLLYIETTSIHILAIETNDRSIVQSIPVDEIVSIYRWQLPTSKVLEVFTDLTDTSIKELQELEHSIHTNKKIVHNIGKLPETIIEAISLIEHNLYKG